MTLLLRNLQKVVALNLPALKKDVESLRRVMHIKRYDIAILCVDDEKMQELNRMYRGMDKPTDVLSFPASELEGPGKLPDPWSDLADLGDIFLGIPLINDQCEKEGTDLELVLPAIITHGFCHLMGYTHETKVEWEEMRDRERSILGKFNEVTGNKTRPFVSVLP